MNVFMGSPTFKVLGGRSTSTGPSAVMIPCAFKCVSIGLLTSIGSIVAVFNSFQ